MTETQAGQPARKLGRGWEVIGPEDCPLMYRRTLLSCRLGKLLWHRFVPGATDKAAHDHPRSFVTILLRGGYTDLSPCPTCAGSPAPGWLLGPPSKDWRHASSMAPCPSCDLGGRIVDEVQAPTVRFRRADHAHITRVGPRGATSIVVMGPIRREWGFWYDGKWLEWRTYERIFGIGWRCP